MRTQEQAQQPDVLTWRTALAATAIAGALYLMATAVESGLNLEFPSWSELAVQVAWMIGVAAVTVVGFAITHSRRPGAADLGLRNGWKTLRNRPQYLLLSVLVVAFGLYAIATSESTPSHDSMSLPLLLATALVRWPVSSLAQQMLFFGWLQPRLGRHGAALAVLFFAAFHLSRPAMAVLVLPIGVLFAYLRKRTDGIVAGTMAHYVINVLFTASMYH